MMQVMLSHPVPSPDVSGAKQWSTSCEEDTVGIKRSKLWENVWESTKSYKTDDSSITYPFKVTQ